MCVDGSVVEDGRIWRGKCASDPKIIAELVRKRAPAVERIVFETGPLSKLRRSFIAQLGAYR